MQEYVVALSKYFIAGFAVLYAGIGLIALCFSDETKQRRISAIQTLFLFVIPFCCFMDLAFVSRNIQYLLFFALVMLLQFAAIAIVPLLYDKANLFLLKNMCMLLSTGLCILSRLSFQKAVKQYAIIVLSLLFCLAIPYLIRKIHFFKRLTWLYAALGIGMLGLVLVLGEITHGSKISFSLGGITFQPSEFVKIIYIFFLAAALWENHSWKRVVLTAVLSGTQVLLLVLSKDLGSALIFFVGFVFVVFAATRNYWYLLAGTAGGSVAAVIAYFAFDHVQTRVLAWKDPWNYIDNQGYQITQSLFAISGGDWFGMGLLKGNPKAIPFVEADFIFSSICEELGVIFGICLIVICLSCFLMMMRIALQIRDCFYQLIVYGIGIMYIFQIFLTVGGGIKFIPLTGVTLPFISYGGSSVMTTMLMFFIIQGIYIRLQEEGERQLAEKVEKKRS